MAYLVLTFNMQTQTCNIFVVLAERPLGVRYLNIIQCSIFSKQLHRVNTTHVDTFIIIIHSMAHSLRKMNTMFFYSIDEITNIHLHIVVFIRSG